MCYYFFFCLSRVWVLLLLSMWVIVHTFWRCHCRKSSGVNNNMNNGCVLFQVSRGVMTMNQTSQTFRLVIAGKAKVLLITLIMIACHLREVAQGCELAEPLLWNVLKKYVESFPPMTHEKVLWDAKQYRPECSWMNSRGVVGKIVKKLYLKQEFSFHTQTQRQGN